MTPLYRQGQVQEKQRSTDNPVMSIRTQLQRIYPSLTRLSLFQKVGLASLVMVPILYSCNRLPRRIAGSTYRRRRTMALSSVRQRAQKIHPLPSCFRRPVFLLSPRSQSVVHSACRLAESEASPDYKRRQHTDYANHPAFQKPPTHLARETDRNHHGHPVGTALFQTRDTCPVRLTRSVWRKRSRTGSCIVALFLSPGL